MKLCECGQVPEHFGGATIYGPWSVWCSRCHRSGPFADTEEEAERLWDEQGGTLPIDPTTGEPWDWKKYRVQIDFAKDEEEGGE